MDKKVIVIGLDGASWEVINILIDNGLLTNLERLKREGVWGNLETVASPNTAPAWASFATGKNPGKHGCYDFTIPNGSLSRLRPICSRDILAELFYEILEEMGKSCALINLPVSYPPRVSTENMENVVISSIMTNSDHHIFPKWLAEKIPNLKNYRLAPDPHIRVNGTIKAYIDDIRELERTRFNCAKSIFEMKKWDFFFYLISGTDWIHHSLYGSLVNRRNFKGQSEAYSAYREFDSYIGWFLKNMEEDTILFVMSDHGFTSRKGFFNVNTWLENLGYLETKKGEEKAELTMRAEESTKLRKQQVKVRVNIGKGLSVMANSRFLGALVKGIYGLVRQVIPTEIISSIGIADLNKSSAYYPRTGTWGIYINDKARFEDGIVEEDAYLQVRNRIVDQLREVKDPDTGEKVFYDILSKEKRYKGEFVELAPDISFKSDIYHSHRNLRPVKFWRRPNNGHYWHGILLASGKSIQKGQLSEKVSILDIIPTVLHIMNAPLIEDMDGKVLEKIFLKESKMANRERRYVCSQTKEELRKKIAQATEPELDEQRVTMRLRNLGYLD